MGEVRWILFILSILGATGALFYVIKLRQDWEEARTSELLTDDYSTAWHSKLRQSTSLGLILFCLGLSALVAPEDRWARAMIFTVVIIGDWKVYKMYTDRRIADVQVAKKKRQ